MEYFSLLNLEREPFSNSPEPGLFYPLRLHAECLQMVEMAIRLRRGLNVVLGEVGTGKTTLCRKLIQQFSSAEDREKIEVHLVLDPAFSTPMEFLSEIARFFGLRAEADAPTEWRLKEAVKAALFAKGVDEGKIVALLIDEGQKLPDFCLELLREFLNYETNDRKLLQIVIFAQTEFEQAIRGRANFADRVNLSFRLRPLNFLETREMINYRIRQSGGPGKRPHLFTPAGMYAVYQATQGYPRSINTLCHHVVLALIIQNRLKAGRSLVRSCAGRLARFRPAGRGRKMILAAVLPAAGLLVLALLLYGPVTTWLWLETGRPTVEAKPAATVSMKEPPSVLGRLRMDKGSSVSLLLREIYGSVDDGFFRVFAGANLHIKDINMVDAGTPVTIPAIPARTEGAKKKSCRVEVFRSENLGKAHERFRASSDLARVMIFPYWNSREGLVFALLLEDRFPDSRRAAQAAKRLPAAMQKDAMVIQDWDEDTVFYRRW